MPTKLPSWVQTSMLAQEIVEVTISLGVVVEGDHLQAQIELRNPVDGTLLDLCAWPHTTLDRWVPLMVKVIYKIEAMLADQVGTSSPFYRHLLLRELYEQLDSGSPPPGEPFP